MTVFLHRAVKRDASREVAHVERRGQVRSGSNERFAQTGIVVSQHQSRVGRGTGGRRSYRIGPAFSPASTHPQRAIDLLLCLYEQEFQ